MSSESKVGPPLEKTPSRDQGQAPSREPRIDFTNIERKWRKRWKKTRPRSPRGTGKRFYNLAFPPSPTGSLHMGHLTNYALADSVTLYQTMRGRRVLAPMGWDSFGLPAENFALRTGIPPSVATRKSIEIMREQMNRLGFAFDWSRETAFSDPEYYRWTQWLFLRLLENGLAYQAKAPVHWCPSCKTALANEQLEGVVCERCGSQVEVRRLKQWFFRMSNYAERLHENLGPLAGKWPDRVIRLQEEWIGRTEGSRIDFEIVAPGCGAHGQSISVFTTRVDGVYGTTFLGLSPDDPRILSLLRGTDREPELLEFCRRKSNEIRRPQSASTLVGGGIDTGLRARNPFNAHTVPIWICDYVASTTSTSVMMGVPAHDKRDFQFAKIHSLPVRLVIQPFDASLIAEELEGPYLGEGVQVNSGPFDGITSRSEARRLMTMEARRKKFGDFSVRYRLGDWLISRQRSWGTPIPIVTCTACGTVPIPDEDLPVLLLPMEKQDEESPGFAPESPSRTVACPRCGAKARPEADTMDTFVDSSWYFLRFLSPRDRNQPFPKGETSKWMPAHQCIGGVEHATRHLIYARFITHALYDLKNSDVLEPYGHLFCQGLVRSRAYHCPTHRWLRPNELDETDHRCARCGLEVETKILKMSKSKRNGVSPDRLVERYGADAVRLAMFFMGQSDRDLVFHEQNVRGVARFLRLLWRTVSEQLAVLATVREAPKKDEQSGEKERESVEPLVQECARIHSRLTTAFEVRDYVFNSILMEIMTLLKKFRRIGDPRTLSSAESRIHLLKNLVKMLSPFTPHLSEELWSRLGGSGPSVFRSSWGVEAFSPIEKTSFPTEKEPVSYVHGSNEH